MLFRSEHGRPQEAALDPLVPLPARGVLVRRGHVARQVLQLLGADDLLHHAEHKLGVRAGGTTADGMFTLEHAECQAACTEAPNMQVNYRHCHRMTTEKFDQLIDDLRAGRLDGDIPPHGTLARVRQHIPADKAAGPVSPDASEASA